MNIALFGNNLFFLYFIACLTIVNFSKYQEWQKVSLIYIVTIGSMLLGIIQPRWALIYLLIVLFVFCEYLTDDSYKLVIFTRLLTKILDFLYIAFFHFYIHFIIIAICLCSSKMQMWYFSVGFEPTDLYFIAVRVISLILLFLAIQSMSTSRFRIKTVTEWMRVFIKYPLYEYQHPSVHDELYSILTAMEDRTFFDRGLSFNFFSGWLIRNKVKSIIDKDGDYGKAKCPQRFAIIIRYIKRLFMFVLRMPKRGYSTLEMQLIRNVAVASEFQKAKGRRKLFELIYSRLFFWNLHKYYCKSNAFPVRDADNVYQFKCYLLYIYINTVSTKINSKRYSPLAKVFQKGDEKPDLSSWSRERFFVACLGLPYSRTELQYRMWDYGRLIDYFGLKTEIIEQEIYELAGEPPAVG